MPGADFVVSETQVLGKAALLHAVHVQAHRPGAARLAVQDLAAHAAKHHLKVAGIGRGVPVGAQALGLAERHAVEGELGGVQVLGNVRAHLRHVRPTGGELFVVVAHAVTQGAVGLHVPRHLQAHPQGATQLVQVPIGSAQGLHQVQARLNPVVQGFVGQQGRALGRGRHGVHRLHGLHSRLCARGLRLLGHPLGAVDLLYSQHTAHVAVVYFKTLHLLRRVAVQHRHGFVQALLVVHVVRVAGLHHHGIWRAVHLLHVPQSVGRQVVGGVLPVGLGLGANPLGCRARRVCHLGHVQAGRVHIKRQPHRPGVATLHAHRHVQAPGGLPHHRPVEGRGDGQVVVFGLALVVVAVVFQLDVEVPGRLVLQATEHCRRPAKPTAGRKLSALAAPVLHTSVETLAQHTAERVAQIAPSRQIAPA